MAKSEENGLAHWSLLPVTDGALGEGCWNMSLCLCAVHPDVLDSACRQEPARSYPAHLFGATVRVMKVSMTDSSFRSL